jgi:hypothetical protein
MNWASKLEWADDEHAARSRRALGAGEREDFRLASIAGASWAAGLAALMLDRHGPARERLVRAADEYRISWEAAPPGSWGRPIAALRCRLLAADTEGAKADALAALEAGAAEAAGPIAAYCACLALLVLGRDDEAAVTAAALAGRDDFHPAAVARALVALSGRDALAYADAAADVLHSFESRNQFLEDMPVADTVLVLDALAGPRGIPAGATTSRLLPASS